MTSNDNQYRSGISRRESLKWLSALSVSALIPLTTGCDVNQTLTTTNIGHWPQLKLAPITAKGYGKDPNLIMPPSSPWPKTLSASQLNLVALLSDIIVPREGEVPSASELNVPDVIDEWVSAPYQWQQSDRPVILALLLWINDEAKLKFSQDFVKLSTKQQLSIIDSIAYQNETIAEEFRQAARAFSRFRQLVLAAFFCTPAGTKDLGYQGNVAIAGDYPGPSKEALAHLDTVLEELNLTL